MDFPRRHFLSATALGSAAMLIGRDVKASDAVAETTEVMPQAKVRIGLNTSTIREQKLPLPKQIEVAAQAGFDAIEPWVRDIVAYEAAGGSLETIRKMAADANLEICSAIGFAKWIVDDPQQRQRGLDEAAADMRRVAAIGGKHIAAPPIGAHRPDHPKPSLDVIAKRYSALCELGKREGVQPQLELWGFSPTLSKLEELVYVATAAAHPSACMLPDFYHVYKGGNDFAGLRMLEASAMPNFHINDYPADPPQNAIADRHRVFPGDGICPLPELIGDLIRRGFRGCFS
ncbi:MAG: sugar phosphate isomerase/epimerase family protein, partial [Planctomycetota bacterium]